MCKKHVHDLMQTTTAAHLQTTVSVPEYTSLCYCHGTVTVKLLFCLITHHAVKVYGRGGRWIYSSMNS